uniref:Uncharacterized protein n=1 Tax=Coralloluteibacterium stylophorae TaxID=1776034 RepID=A0A8J7VYS2_9GAMM
MALDSQLEEIMDYHCQVSLLQRLSESEQIRAAIRSNPVAALSSLGVAVQARDVPETVNLPAPGEMRRALRSVDRDNVAPMVVMLLHK